MRISDWSSDVCSSDLACHDLGLLAFEVVHTRFHGRLIHAVLNGRHDTGNAAFDLGKRLSIKFDLCATLVVLAVELLRTGTHGVSDRIGGNALVRHSRQNAALDVFGADGMAILAGSPQITVKGGRGAGDP